MEYLTRFERVILAALKAKQGEAVNRTDLIKACYPEGNPPVSNSIEVVIRRLRNKLGDGASITTVRGVGYKLEQPAEVTA